MYNYQRIIISIFVLFFSLYHLAFALGERVTELADKVGDSVGIGRTATEINKDTDTALNKLFKTTPAAVKLSKSAKAILIYPKILKAGIGFGGQHGEGALRKQGKTVAYYNTVAASYGLQIGAQSFGFAMFFMNDKALQYLNSSDGWEVGVGPSVVMVDEGMAKSLTTTTTKDDVYVFTFNQQGLMAGAGIQGSKITKITPEK
ncbi:MAG: lipid-binding SYLF domain-containing protein [Gammaproteobacteria bacterium]|nr:lipid-binding SYLF domain-containing protein [Gammaproteobacteria bacterium]